MVTSAVPSGEPAVRTLTTYGTVTAATWKFGPSGRGGRVGVSAAVDGPYRVYSHSPSAEMPAKPALPRSGLRTIKRLPSRVTTTAPPDLGPGAAPTQRDPLAAARNLRSRGNDAGGGSAQPTSAGPTRPGA